MMGLRLRRVDKGQGSVDWLGAEDLPSWLGIYRDRFGNHYRCVSWWRPSFWVFILRDPLLEGQRLEALAANWGRRREFLG